MTAPKSKSLVVERLRPWLGRVVEIRTTWNASVIGLLAAVLPVGREYMLEVIEADRRPRLVNVSGVLEVCEVTS